MTTLSPDDLAFARATARRSAARFASSPFHDDLVSAGLEAAVHAVARFDCSRGVPLRHYLAIRVRGAVIDEWRRLAGTRRRGTDQLPLSLDRLLDDAPNLPVRDEAPSPEDALEAKETAATALALAGTLPGREGFVLRERLAGRLQEEIGAVLGVTKSRVCQIEQRATRRLRSMAATA